MTPIILLGKNAILIFLNPLVINQNQAFTHFIEKKNIKRK
jgi:hypothetical protein